MSFAVPVSWLCLVCGLVETLLVLLGMSALFSPGPQVYGLLLAALLEPAALASVVVAALLLAYARWPAVAQTFPWLWIGPERPLDSRLCLVLFVALALNLVAIAGMAATCTMEVAGSVK